MSMRFYLPFSIIATYPIIGLQLVLLPQEKP